MKNYVSLHNHDTFSVKDGLYKPIKYLEKVKEMGGEAFAQTNHGTLAGVFDFFNACKYMKIKPIIGAEFYFVDDKTTKDKPSHIILLAKNYEGYKSLLKAQYYSNKNGFYYKPRIDWSNLGEMSGNVVVMSACSSGIIAKPLLNGNIKKAEENIEKLKYIFGKDFYFEYIALSRIQFYKDLWKMMYDLSEKFDVKSVITTDTHYIHKSDYKIQQILHNIYNKVTIDDLNKGKGWTMDDKDLYIKSYDEIMEIMSPIFDKEIIVKCLDNTFEISHKIEEYEIYPTKFVFPKVDFKEEKLKSIIKNNLEKKPKIKPIEEYKKRLNYEYKIIKQLGFLEYFWIVTDIVNWAKRNNIFVGGGRGSAAGSLVSYLLDITDIDPLKFNLSFERFLNPTRTKKAPDIDIDFQKSHRQKVLSYIRQYGENNVVQIGSYVEFSLKSALKDVLRIYNISFKEANFVSENIEKKEIKEKYQKYFEIARKLEGNIRNFGTHAAGVVVTDKPVYDYIPTVYNSKNKEVVSAIDGETLTNKRFLKIDILGVRGLDIIFDTLEMIKEYENKKVDIHNIKLKDDNIYRMFRELDVNNIFQFDTPAMRGYKRKFGYGGYKVKGMIERMQPTKFKHLIEINAINRPGALSNKTDEKYEARRFGASYKIPKLLEKHLSKTYGLLIYQEQVILILSDWLDISAGEADIYRKKLEKSSIKDILNENNYYTYLYNKYDKKDIEEGIKFLEQSGGYSFNKSHATSYTMLAYQMAYLKCYYRKYFNVAVLNNLELNNKKDQARYNATLDECLNNGILLSPYNLNEISYQFEIGDDGKIIPGVKVLKGVGEKSIIEVISKKPYRDLKDFLLRCNVNKKVIEVLNKNDFFYNAFGTELSAQEILDMKKQLQKDKKNGPTLF